MAHSYATFLPLYVYNYFSSFLVTRLSHCVCFTCLFVFISSVQISHSILPCLTFHLCVLVLVHVLVGSHVVDLGPKLLVITPIMNHHALFSLSSSRGIYRIMKLSFSLRHTLCPHTTHLTNTAVHKEWVMSRFIVHKRKSSLLVQQLYRYI